MLDPFGYIIPVATPTIVRAIGLVRFPGFQLNVLEFGVEVPYDRRSSICGSVLCSMRPNFRHMKHRGRIISIEAEYRHITCYINHVRIQQITVFDDEITIEFWQTIKTQLSFVEK